MSMIEIEISSSITRIYVSRFVIEIENDVKNYQKQETQTFNVRKIWVMIWLMCVYVCCRQNLYFWDWQNWMRTRYKIYVFRSYRDWKRRKNYQKQETQFFNVRYDWMMIYLYVYVLFGASICWTEIEKLRRTQKLISQSLSSLCMCDSVWRLTRTVRPYTIRGWIL